MSMPSPWRKLTWPSAPWVMSSLPSMRQARAMSSTCASDTGEHRLAGALVPGCLARKHQRRRADAVGVAMRAGEGRCAVLGERLEQIQEPPARGNDCQVGRSEVLGGALDDGAHTFLDGQVLLADAANTRVGAAAGLGGTIEQVVVVDVAQRHEGLRIDLGMDARPRLDAGDLLRVERPIRMPRDGEADHAAV